MRNLIEVNSEEYQRVIDHNRDLNDSIRYALSMQQGMLPKRRHFQRIWPQTAVFYRPKDIISGDFYYIGQKEGEVYWAVGDCSGHGVPGAMLTMLGTSFLNYAIQNKQHGGNIGSILNEMDKKLCETFIYGSAPEHIDISLMSYQINNNVLKYSGARRKMVLIRNGEMISFRGNNYPLGGLQIEHNRQFDQIEIRIEKGDVVYIGSDGYQDQFGGQNDKKFTAKRLHNLLIEISEFDIHFQKIILLQTFSEWRDDQPQIDDVCIMGIQF